MFINLFLDIINIHNFFFIHWKKKSNQQYNWVKLAQLVKETSILFPYEKGKKGKKRGENKGRQRPNDKIHVADPGNLNNLWWW